MFKAKKLLSKEGLLSMRDLEGVFCHYRTYWFLQRLYHWPKMLLWVSNVKRSLEGLIFNKKKTCKKSSLYTRSTGDLSIYHYSTYMGTSVCIFLSLFTNKTYWKYLNHRSTWGRFLSMKELPVTWGTWFIYKIPKTPNGGIYSCVSFRRSFIHKRLFSIHRRSLDPQEVLSSWKTFRRSSSSIEELEDL